MSEESDDTQAGEAGRRTRPMHLRAFVLTLAQDSLTP